MVQEEIKLIDAIFSSLAKNGKQRLDQIFFRSSDMRSLVGNRHELNAFLWNHSHLFYFDHSLRKYGNQDRERYSPFFSLLFTHLIRCTNCTIGCLLNFVIENENQNQLDISEMRQHYCGLDSDGFLHFLQDHEGLFVINGDNCRTKSEIRLNQTALKHKSIKFPDLNSLPMSPNISVRDNSCTAYGTATITAVDQRHNSVFMQFITMDCADDNIFCAMNLLSFDPQREITVDVKAVRMYNTSCPWRATSVKLATDLRKSTSCSETKCSALFKLLRMPNSGKSAEIIINQVQPRNVFASTSELWIFVKSNPQLFRTRGDTVYLRSTEHIEAFANLTNSLGPGSYSMALLGDTLDEVCFHFWQSAYVSHERQKRLVDFYHDHEELFTVLIEFPDPLENEIKLLCKPLRLTLSQLEELKAAQKTDISPPCSTIAHSEDAQLLSSDSDSEIECVSSNEEEILKEMVTVAEYSCINDTPISPIGIVLRPRSLPCPDSNRSKSDCSRSRTTSVITEEPQQSVEIKQTVFTLAVLSEIEKQSVELVDECFLVDESLDILQLYEKLKHSKLRPFANIGTFKEFLSRRPHLYILVDESFVSRLDAVRRTRISELLRLIQTQRSVTELFQQLSETDQNLLGNKGNLFVVLLKYEKLFEVTEEWDGERFVKARGTYNTKTGILLPQIYGDLRITSECVQQKLAVKKMRKPIFTKLELQKLIDKARQFMTTKKSNLTKSTENMLSRCKPLNYYKEIEDNQNLIEQPYIKDKNGHERSPINGRIKGLFFNVGRVEKSPFGDVCYRFERTALFNRREFELYFADFYCPPRLPCSRDVPIHKVTLVVAKKQTDSWTYCHNYLIKLDWERNDFFILIEGEKCQVVTGKYGDVLLVEILFLEALNLRKGKRSIVETIGSGQSRPLGLPANEQCEICSI